MTNQNHRTFRRLFLFNVLANVDTIAPRSSSTNSPIISAHDKGINDITFLVHQRVGAILPLQHTPIPTHQPNSMQSTIASKTMKQITMIASICHLNRVLSEKRPDFEWAAALKETFFHCVFAGGAFAFSHIRSITNVY